MMARPASPSNQIDALHQPGARPTPLSDQILAQLRREFPRFRLQAKSESRLSAAIDLGLRLVTLGRQNRYLTEYHTVIGETLFVAPTWQLMSDESRLVLLRHERVHLQQRRRLGSVWMAVLYLLPIAPLGLAWGRARLEWEAYVETLRATAELFGVDRLADPELKRSLVERFTGPDYGWMWPFPRAVSRWYDRAVQAIEHQMREPGAGGRGESQLES